MNSDNSVLTNLLWTVRICPHSNSTKTPLGSAVNERQHIHSDANNFKGGSSNEKTVLESEEGSTVVRNLFGRMTEHLRLDECWDFARSIRSMLINEWKSMSAKWITTFWSKFSFSWWLADFLIIFNFYEKWQWTRTFCKKPKFFTVENRREKSQDELSCRC